MRDLVGLLYEIELRRNLPHRWERGRDCVSAALACVEAQTGVDLLADLPEWSSRREARKVASDLGGLIAALDARMDRIPPALAKRGDVAGIPEGTFGVQLMIVEGATLVGPGDKGQERQPRSAMTMAWNAETARRVPHD